jgi:uncharacterized protein (TIGR02118 family)
MLIRSGLIQNKDGVDPAAFGQHWREVHGPLAKRLPNLRGYVQNYIVARGEAAHANRIHRIDGISQLWFDDVDAMVAGMSSPENDACVVDISGFLACVTLAVQDPGAWIGSGKPEGAKLMAVYIGDGEPAAIAQDVGRLLGEAEAVPSAFRVNAILGHNFIVDPTVPRSEAPIVAVLEAFFADDATRARAIDGGALNRGQALAPAAIMAVTRVVFIAPPAT